MKFGTFLIGAMLVAGGHQLWTKHQDAVLQRKVLASADKNGFISVEMPSGASLNTVLIFAPLNCPKEATQRANALAQQLTALGIANVRTDRYALQSPTEEQINNMQSTAVVMNGELPVVLINGMGKANPTLEAVASEYRLGK